MARGASSAMLIRLEVTPRGCAHWPKSAREDAARMKAVRIAPPRPWPCGEAARFEVHKIAHRWPGGRSKAASLAEDGRWSPPAVGGQQRGAAAAGGVRRNGPRRAGKGRGLRAATRDGHPRRCQSPAPAAA